MPGKLARLTQNSTAAFLMAVLCFYPLYIKQFSNLGVTKFTACFTLFLLFILWLGACTAIGARAPAGRFSDARRDPTLLGLAAFVMATLIATVFSLSPHASLWGLGGYYGGLMMVLFTAAGYLCVRSYADGTDLDLLFFGIGAAASIAAVLYTLNIFNIDLIGAYENTAVHERAQFFSTLGQKDFNASFFAVALPIVFWCFLNAESVQKAALYGIPAVFGTLALAVVDSEALTLGLAAAVMVMVCQKDFTTRTLRRMLLLGAAFFAWAGWMHAMRASVYTQGGTSLLAKFGARPAAVTGVLVCLIFWALLAARATKGKTEVPLWKPGRVLTVLALIFAVLAVLLANLLPGLPLPERLHNLLVFSDDWGTYRGTAWRVSASTWAQAPFWRKLIGFGPGSMHAAVADWAGEGMTPRIATFYAAHNEYLEELLTTGLLGLGAWGLFAGSHLVRGLRGWQCPGAAPIVLALCSYLAQAAVSIRVCAVFPLVMLLFALLAALTAPQAPEPAPVQSRPSRRKKTKAAAPAQVPRGQTAKRRALITAAALLCMAAAGGVRNVIFWFLL
ncbi:MAG: O-antigen ligase family protein [Oscillospiraceae bacterium]|nr:O-antigen ligase family protein [Oscillospiraceae bacterium]